MTFDEIEKDVDILTEVIPRVVAWLTIVAGVVAIGCQIYHYFK